MRSYTPQTLAERSTVNPIQPQHSTTSIPGVADASDRESTESGRVASGRPLSLLPVPVVSR